MEFADSGIDFAANFMVCAGPGQILDPAKIIDLRINDLQMLIRKSSICKLTICKLTIRESTIRESATPATDSVILRPEAAKLEAPCPFP
jgi:hypothetical protein